MLMFRLLLALPCEIICLRIFLVICLSSFVTYKKVAGGLNSQK